MVIQFSCPGCTQPIEVDGEWGGQHVACPFCQRVVTAPTESTLREVATAVPPTARKVARTSTDAAPQAGDAATTGVSRAGILGFGFSLATIFLLILAQLIILSVLGPLGADLTPLEAQKKLMEAWSNPQTSTRVWLCLAASGLSFCCWVTGIVLCVLALTNRQQAGRRVAVAGLACALIPIGQFCLGLWGA